MERRNLLSIMCLLCVGSAGCFSRSSPEIGLGRLIIQNLASESVEVDVVVEKGGESAYENSFTISGNGDEIGRREIEEHWMGEKTDYEITISDQNNTISTSTEEILSLVEEWGESRCFELSFGIRTNRISRYFGFMDDCP